MTPRLAAQTDWYMTGSFTPERYQGAERDEYEQEAARILRQWDNQPN